MRRFYPIILIAIIFFSGCSTIATMGKHEVLVNSSPAGARISVNNVDYGVFTPGVIDVSKPGEVVTIQFEKEGYDLKEYGLKRKFRYFTLCNLIAYPYGMLGIVIDLYTYSGYYLIPEEINVTLTPKNE